MHTHRKCVCLYLYLMKKSLYLLLAAVLFVGCHRDEKTDEPVAGPFVFFETRVGEAGTLPQRDGEAFGVFGYLSSEDTLTNVFSDYEDRIAKVAWNAEDQAFSYEKLVEWSEGTYSFYAYYPYAYRNQDRLAVIENERSNTLHFVQPCELDEMTDFMTASVGAVSRTLEPVRLQFVPHLFCVDVVIINEDDMDSATPGITVLDAEIDFVGVPQSLDFDFESNGCDMSKETVRINADLFTASSGFHLGSGMEYNFTKELGSSFFLIPAKGIKYSIAIEYVGEDGEADIYTYPEDSDWAELGDVVKAGGHYAIVINASSNTAHIFSASLVSDWEEKVDINNDFN